MKKLTQTLLALAAFGGAALFAQAQPAPKILVIDMAKIFNEHYKTADQTAKLNADKQKAQEEIERQMKEGNALVDKYKDLVDQSNNPAATADAKSKAQTDAQKLVEDIQKKQRELQTFESNTSNALQQRFQNFKSVVIDEISKLATDMAKKKGATILIDKSGPSMIGVPNMLYTDPAYDITDEVIKEINKDRPATAPVAAPAAAKPDDAKPASPDSPQITFPGATPKK